MKSLFLFFVRNSLATRSAGWLAAGWLARAGQLSSASLPTGCLGQSIGSRLYQKAVVGASMLRQNPITERRLGVLRRSAGPHGQPFCKTLITHLQILTTHRKAKTTCGKTMTTCRKTEGVRSRHLATHRKALTTHRKTLATQLCF